MCLAPDLRTTGQGYMEIINCKLETTKLNLPRRTYLHGHSNMMNITFI